MSKFSFIPIIARANCRHFKELPFGHAMMIENSGTTTVTLHLYTSIAKLFHQDAFEKQSPFLFSDLDECLSDPCQNNGSCIDQPSLFSCNCPLGWNGTHCEIGKSIKDLTSNISGRRKLDVQTK